MILSTTEEISKAHMFSNHILEIPNVSFNQKSPSKRERNRKRKEERVKNNHKQCLPKRE